LPSMGEALSFIPSTTKGINERKEKEEEIK
jgi:hypothetical protein